MKQADVKVCDICKGKNKKITEDKCEICDRDVCLEHSQKMMVSTRDGRLVYFIDPSQEDAKEKINNELMKSAIHFNIFSVFGKFKKKEKLEIEKEGILICDNCYNNWNNARNNIVEPKKFLKRLCKAMKDEIIINNI